MAARSSLAMSTICQDRPYLSFSQPHIDSLPPAEACQAPAFCIDAIALRISSGLTSRWWVATDQ